MTGKEKLWFLGDEFADASFTEHMRHARAADKQNYFSFIHYEVTDFMTTRYSSSIRNILAQVKCLLKKAITQEKYLPKGIVLAYDDDIIKQLRLKYEFSKGFALDLGYLCKEIH